VTDRSSDLPDSVNSHLYEQFIVIFRHSDEKKSTMKLPMKRPKLSDHQPPNTPGLLIIDATCRYHNDILNKMSP